MELGHLKMRIGIHHGSAVVGNFGSAQRSDYTAIGPCVNMAARIESASQAGEVFVSEATAKLMRDGATVEVGAFELKGIEGEAMLYRVEYWEASLTAHGWTSSPSPVSIPLGEQVALPMVMSKVPAAVLRPG